MDNDDTHTTPCCFRRIAAGAGLALGLASLTIGLGTPSTAAVDPPTCGGKAATIVGTDGPDYLQGTPGDDVVVLGAGNDRFHGLDGDDVICGGAGNDVIRGGDGDDVVWVVKDPEGREGFDTISTGRGRDYVNSTSPYPDIRLGAGDDRADVTFLTGGLRAGRGDDLVRFDRTSPKMDGGPGDDRFVQVDSGITDPGPYNNATTSVIIGGPGHDRLRFTTQEDVRIDVPEGEARWRAGRMRFHELEAYAGGHGDDALIGSHRGERLSGGDGNDLLIGGPGRDVLQGGPGRDRAYGGPGRDRCTAETERSC